MTSMIVMIIVIAMVTMLAMVAVAPFMLDRACPRCHKRRVTYRINGMGMYYHQCNNCGWRDDI
jgi:flagellar basal body-associated protein FliL